MAELPVPSGGSYCIDTTEVTVAQFLAFTKASDIPGAPSYCGQLGIEQTPWTMCSGPGGVGRAAWKDSDPIGCVNWCQAFQFCQWAGKRLCGAIGGGHSAKVYMGKEADPKSQWFNACTEFGKHDYCYGDLAADGVCIGKDSANGQPVAVGSASGCHPPDPPFSDVFDLLGNVEEWEDACDAYAAPTDGCMTRRSDYTDAPGFEEPCLAAQWGARGMLLPGVGFRCCAD